MYYHDSTEYDAVVADECVDELKPASDMQCTSAWEVALPTTSEMARRCLNPVLNLN